MAKIKNYLPDNNITDKDIVIGSDGDVNGVTKNFNVATLKEHILKDVPTSIVETIVAGANISIDNTDPSNPIVSAVDGIQNLQQVLTEGNTAATDIVLENNVKVKSTDGKKYFEVGPIFAQIVAIVGDPGDEKVARVEVEASGDVSIYGDGSVNIRGTLINVTGKDSLTFEGVHYNDDYSANFIDRSLVDKGYVDGELVHKLDSVQAGTNVTIDNTDPLNPIINAIGADTALELVTEAGNTGIRKKGANPLNYGNIGRDAVDLSYQGSTSSTKGATGLYSFAEGNGNTASGEGSHAEGGFNISNGSYSHTEGGFCLASGNQSHAEGDGTTSSGNASHSGGRGNLARSECEMSIGIYGTDYTPNSTVTDRLFNIGNGVGVSNRSNAFTIFKNGAVKIFRATLASITNTQVGLFIINSLTNRLNIHDGTQWNEVAYLSDISGGGGATDLSYTASPTNGIVVSSTGTDATIPLADGTNAGLITPAEKTAIADIPTKTSDLINDGDNGTSHFISLEDLPSNLVLYPTSSASDISGYSKIVTSITDPSYDVTAVDITTGVISGSNQLIASLATSANIIIGNPGLFNVSTIGNIKRTAGSGTAEFYFEVYKRTSGGTETLITTSSNTSPISSAIYSQFSATALWNDGIFLDTDRIIIKFYGTKVGSGSAPTYDFQFGGSNPVRTTVPIPLNVVPNINVEQLNNFSDVSYDPAIDTDSLMIKDVTNSLWKRFTIANLKALIRSTPLTGLVTTSTTQVTETDSVVVAIGELQGQLNTKISGYNYENTTSSATLTGTTTETQIIKVTIPANTFSTSDFFKFNAIFSKTGILGAATIRAKLSTSATMTTGNATSIALHTTSATNRFIPFQRNSLVIKSGAIIGFPFIQTSVTDYAIQDNPVSSVAFDVTVTQYFYISVTLANAADSIYLSSLQITNI